MSLLGSTWSHISGIPSLWGSGSEWPKVLCVHLGGGSKAADISLGRWSWSSMVTDGHQWVPVSAGLAMFSTISSLYYWLGSLTKSDPRTLTLTHKSSSTIDYLHGSPFQALFSGWLSSASWTSLSVPACPPAPGGLVSSNFFDFLTPLSRPSLSQLLPHLHML